MKVRYLPLTVPMIELIGYTHYSATCTSEMKLRMGRGLQPGYIMCYSSEKHPRSLNLYLRIYMLYYVNAAVTLFREKHDSVIVCV